MPEQHKQLKLRHEFKYLLHHGAYLQLSAVLAKMMSRDLHSKGKGYQIRSLYLDDAYDTALKEKASGDSIRKKYRIRIYDYSDHIIKLEIKEKYQDYIQKKSSVISREEYEKIIDGDIGFLNDPLDSTRTKYFLEFRNNRLTPKVIVDYDREAYVLPYNQIRITFDKYLSAAVPHRNIFDKDMYSKQVGDEYAMIMEVKYNNFFPVHLREMLQKYCGNRLAISKYYICRRVTEF